jgi:guanylate kinase
MMLARRGLCLVIAAPSGAGKTAITRALLDSDPGLSLSVSVTTRAPRAGERDGTHYHFIDQPRFDAMVTEGALLEYAQVFGRSYGTPRAAVEHALALGRDVVFDVDWQGYRQLRQALPGDVVGLFILPPSREELETRLRGRGDAQAMVAHRMEQADAEMSHAREFDYVLVNDDFDTALAQTRAVLQAERMATARLVGLAAVLGGMGSPE